MKNITTKDGDADNRLQSSSLQNRDEGQENSFESSVVDVDSHLKSSLLQDSDEGLTYNKIDQSVDVIDSISHLQSASLQGNHEYLRNNSAPSADVFKFGSLLQTMLFDTRSGDKMHYDTEPSVDAIDLDSHLQSFSLQETDGCLSNNSEPSADVFGFDSLLPILLFQDNDGSLNDNTEPSVGVIDFDGRLHSSSLQEGDEYLRNNSEPSADIFNFDSLLESLSFRKSNDSLRSHTDLHVYEELNKPLQNLPLEIINHIFQYMSTETQGSAMLACRAWYDLGTRMHRRRKFNLGVYKESSDDAYNHLLANNPNINHILITMPSDRFLESIATHLPNLEALEINWNMRANKCALINPIYDTRSSFTTYIMSPDAPVLTNNERQHCMNSPSYSVSDLSIISKFKNLKRINFTGATNFTKNWVPTILKLCPKVTTLQMRAYDVYQLFAVEKMQNLSLKELIVEVGSFNGDLFNFDFHRSPLNLTKLTIIIKDWWIAYYALLLKRGDGILLPRKCHIIGPPKREDSEEIMQLDLLSYAINGHYVQHLTIENFLFDSSLPRFLYRHFPNLVTLRIISMPCLNRRSAKFFQSFFSPINLEHVEVIGCTDVPCNIVMTSLLDSNRRKFPKVIFKRDIDNVDNSEYKYIQV